MPTKQQRAVLLERERALRAMATSEEELERIRARIARRVRRIAEQEAGRARLGRAVEERIRRRVERELQRELDARYAAIERAVERAASVGPAAAQREVRAVFGADAPSITIVSEPDASAFARALISRREFTVDGVTLSRRLHAADQATSRAVARSLTDSLRAGHSMRDAAEELLRVEDPVVHLPRYVQRLREAAAAGSPRELRRAAFAALRTAQRYQTGEVGLSGAVRQLARSALEQGSAATQASIDRQVQFWVLDRARYTEQRIVRTESARAMTSAYVATTRDEDFVVGYRWNLSDKHPKPDVCDQHAEQNLHGLGPGGYPADEVPALPAHPHCLCYLTSILDEDFDRRELARLRGQAEPPRSWESGPRETAVEWMERQPPDRQQAILGPGRAAQFRRKPSSVVRPDGTHAPLWQAQGRARPARADGPATTLRTAGPAPYGRGRLPPLRRAPSGAE